MRFSNPTRRRARDLCLFLICASALSAADAKIAPSAAPPRVQTVTPGASLKTARFRTHSVNAGLIGGAGVIAPPVSPVSLVRTSAGALGLYAVADDANKDTDSVTNHGGPLIVTTQLELIFWGSKWPTAVNPSPNQVVASVQSMLAGPYLSQMKQYGFQNITLRGVTYATTDPPVNYTETHPLKFVWDLILGGAFPEPDEPGGRILYMVIMPPGTVAPGADLGAHGDPVDPAPLDYDRAWVGWVGYGNLNTITKVLSHEIVEALSDPEPNTPAWTMGRELNGGNEIGDACNNTSDFWNGILVQAYWSQQYSACVLPVGSGRPEIQSLSANSGPVSGGTKVVIQGRFLANAQSVAFGGVPAASYTVDSMTQITAFSPPFDPDLYPNGPRTFDVVVTTPFGQSVTGSAGKFSYYPVVKGVLPKTGSMIGGEVVDVTGEGFEPIRSTAIRFGGAVSTNVYCNTTTHCTVLTPASPPGTVHVFAKVDGVESVASTTDHFTYSGPRVNAISPGVGPEEGGTYVHLTGVGFDDSMRVRFGGTWSDYVVCEDATRCTTRSPAGTGIVNIVANVRGVESPATASNAFRYAAFPAIQSIAPTRGPATGGTVVSITGVNFAAGATVRFGTAAASNVQCTATRCVVTSPPGLSLVDVTVTAGGLTSLTTGSDRFSYVPVVTSVTPNKGPETGGTSVTIHGAGFASTQFSSYPSARFGATDTLAPPYCPTANSCTVASPAGTGIQDVHVIVDGQASSATAADRFAYTASGGARGWTQWNLSPSGATSGGSAAAYDTLRRAVLLYTWTFETGAQTFTWNAGSAAWQAHTPAASPQVFASMMAFDELRGTAVLFGGRFLQSAGPPPVFRIVADTWTWDGSNWKQLALATAPPRRTSGSMVFDRARNKIVLFGGCSTSCSSLLGDTWTFDGTAWTQEHPVNSPPARYGAALVYDPVTATTVLFGGENGSGLLDDQWSWNGVNWTQANPAVIPPARKTGALAYSRRDGGLILFGGTGVGVNLNDTWLWDGIRWTQLKPASSPDGGSYPFGMVYDTAFDVDVMLTVSSTWTWGGQ